jgi:DNA mismatch repair protein MutL
MEIQILPPEVVDQIAAGEVVERPSHLVKELVENSLDAGATEVTVEFSEGGRFVRVVDNGKGISPEVLPFALERFATSKISKSEDLWSLSSFGFRGEALASISSVSRLTMISRQKNSEQAYQIISEFGKKSSVDPVGGSYGTSITVQELFGNIPARLKFLKSESAEATQIKNALKALALAHPEVDLRV